MSRYIYGKNNGLNNWKFCKDLNVKRNNHIEKMILNEVMCNISIYTIGRIY